MVFLRHPRCISCLFLFFLYYIYVPDSFSENAVNRYDFYFSLSDGVKLDCSKFVPETKPPKNGFPCVIFCHGFGRSKDDAISESIRQSKYGFYTLCYSMRGQGNSEGYSNLISTTEMNDLIEVIQYVKNETVVNHDRIGITGSSQGGIIPLMAACYGADVRCVIPDLASPEFASSWIENGCVKMTFVWSLSYDNSIVRYNEEVKQYRGWALSDEKSGWQNLAASLPVNRDFSDRMKDLKVPVLISNSWQDKFFNANGYIKSIPYLVAPYRMYFGSVTGHGGYVSDKERSFHARFVGEWITYWLTDKQNLALRSNKFVYASTSYTLGNSLVFTRFESPVWPPADVRNVEFYFADGNRLSPSPGSGNITFINDITDPALTTERAVNYAFKGERFESGFHKTELYFDTEILERDYKMAGTPHVNLNYSSDADVCQFNFQIWEAAENRQNFITSINFTDRDYTPNTVREKLIDGQASSHIFKKGSRIRVILTNLDTRSGDKFLRTYPLVLPVIKRANNIIYAAQSYLILPLQ
jgi:predicted acyl esterase